MTCEIVFYLNGFYVFLKDYQNLLVGILTILAGLYGFNKWRYEMVGKRKFEIAEEVLTAAYQYREVLSYIRAPKMSDSEGSSRDADGFESDDEKKYKDRCYIIIERAQKNSDFYARFQSLKYPFVAYFDKEAEQAFVSINRIWFKVLNTSRNLMEAYRELDEYEANPEYKELLSEWKKIIGWKSFLTEDPIRKEIDDVINQFEVICKTYLSDTRKGQS